MTWTHWVSNLTNAPSCRRPLSRFGSSNSKVKDHQLATENSMSYWVNQLCVIHIVIVIKSLTHLIVTRSTIIWLLNEHVIGHCKCHVVMFINFVAKQFQWQHFPWLCYVHMFMCDFVLLYFILFLLTFYIFNVTFYSLYIHVDSDFPCYYITLILLQFHEWFDIALSQCLCITT